MTDQLMPTDLDANSAPSDMDELRAFGFAERGRAPATFPTFSLSFLIAGAPAKTGADERMKMTEKVTIWLDKAGNVVVEWLDALTAPGAPGLALRAAKYPDISLRRVIVKSDYSHQPTIELVVREGEPRVLVVRVGDWPEFMRDVRVLAQAGHWKQSAATDGEGEASFALPAEIGADAVRVELLLASN